MTNQRPRDQRTTFAERGDRISTSDMGELLRRFHETRDRALRNRILEAHRWLAVVCARQLGNRGEPLDDLTQVAMIGILKAVERFDPSYGVAFKTYASVTAMGELRRHYRDATWRIRVPRRLQELHLDVNGAIDKLTNELKRSPTVDDLARYLHIEAEDVIDALCAGTNYRTVPLTPVNDDSDGDEDSGAEGETLGFEDPRLADAAERADLVELLQRLPARERRILHLRFFKGLTQSEIAEELGLSQVHISRLLRSALDRLRQAS